MTLNGFVKRPAWRAVLAMVLLAVSAGASAKLYRWVDEAGVVHYSDKLPPEHAKDAHEELDQRGNTVKDIDRAKTKEERMEAELREKQAEREREQKAEKQARKRRQDQILLQTFTTERDLLITRDDRLEAIDSIINLTLSNNKRLEEQIEASDKRIEVIEKNGRDVPENLIQKRENLQSQYRKNKEFIESKQQERTRVENKFEADLKRFRELKGQESGDTEAAAVEPDQPAAEQTPAANPPPPAEQAPAAGPADENNPS